MAARIIRSAVMRYASTGTSERSGFIAQSSQVEQQRVGADKGLARWADDKTKGLVERTKVEAEQTMKVDCKPRSP